jgi:putative endonuclease
MLKKLFGDRGEKRAVKYLKKNGYSIIERNYRTFFGEVDIIAVKDGTLIFVEVKTRNTAVFGMGYEAVGAEKQKNIRQSALLYCKKHQKLSLLRFDVISIDKGVITHIENAF